MGGAETLFHLRDGRVVTLNKSRPLPWGERSPSTLHLPHRNSIDITRGRVSSYEQLRTQEPRTQTSPEFLILNEQIEVGIGDPIKLPEFDECWYIGAFEAREIFSYAHPNSTRKSHSRGCEVFMLCVPEKNSSYPEVVYSLSISQFLKSIETK